MKSSKSFVKKLTADMSANDIEQLIAAYGDGPNAKHLRARLIDQLDFEALLAAGRKEVLKGIRERESK